MVEYRYDPERKLLLGKISGVLRAADFGDSIPDVPIGTLELLDARGAEKAELSSSEVRELAERDMRGPDRISRLALLADTEVGFGLGRMYQTLSESMTTEVRVFRDENAAWEWLGLEPPSRSSSQ